MFMDADQAVHVSVQIEGIEVAASVMDLVVEDDDRLIDKATLVLNDPLRFVADIPREGQKMTVDMGWVSEHAVLFMGDIADVAVRAVGSGQQVTIHALDPSHTLMRQPTRSAHHVGKLSDILKKLIAAADTEIAIGQIELDADPDFTTDQPLRQYNRRDWEFIQQLADRYGCRASVEIDGGGPTFFFVSLQRLMTRDTLAVLRVGPMQGPLLDFEYRRLAGAAAPVRAAVTTDPLTGAAVSEASLPGTPEDPPVVNQSVSYRLTSNNRSAGDYENAMDVVAGAAGLPETQYPQETIPGMSSCAATAATLVARDPTRVRGQLAKGTTTGNIGMRSKERIEIAGAAGWAHGPWYLRQVRHVYSRRRGKQAADTYVTRFVATR
jgi:hypothetical protein